MIVFPSHDLKGTATTGYANETLQDYLGLPTKIPDYEHSALFTRAYNHIYNEWYRDQNLVDSAVVDTDDGPDSPTDYVIRKRGKRHDYFTSCLPWLQKGDSIELPLGTSANIYTDATQSTSDLTVWNTNAGQYDKIGTAGSFAISSTQTGLEADKLYADLSTATASTINQLRQSFQIQKLLERDARSGTRYAEIVKSHFGVNFLDVTYRPEYLGGSSTPINIHTVPQTSETNTTPQGNLSGFGTASESSGGFTKSFTDHCIIIGIA